MALRDYYLSELAYLREHGREFARANPEAARYLGEAGSDPDVERLLEGFAFLAGRLRQRLDDEEPYLTKGLLDLFKPQFLRPFPSVSIQQFQYVGGALSEDVAIPAGTAVAGTTGNGHQCTFQTSADLHLVPLRIYDLQIDRGENPSLHLGIEVIDGLTFADIAAESARLHFVGDQTVAQCWRLCFLHLCTGITLADGGGKQISISNRTVQASGLGVEETIHIDGGQAYQGFESLIEYWHCPEKFHAIQLNELSAWQALGDARRARLTIHLSRLPAPMPTLNAADCQWNCVPAVNVYEHSAVPLQLDPYQTRYRIRPDGEGREVYSVKRVSARLQDGSGQREYHPMYRRLRGSDAAYAYHVLPDKGEWWLRFGGAEMAALVDGVDIGSVDLLVTDGDAPNDLGVGEVRDVIDSASALAITRNVQRPSRPTPAPPSDDAYWRLLGDLSLNFRRFQSVSDIRQLLRVFHFAAITERDAERRLSLVLNAIHAVEQKPGRRLVRGALVSGVDIRVVIDDELIGGDGALHLLGSVLHTMLAHAVTINAYSHLTIEALRSRELLTWPMSVGRRSII